MNTRPYDVAILGATGAVGQRFAQLLEGHPWFRVREVAASERSAGKRYHEATRWILPGAPPPQVADLPVLPLDADFQSPIILSALPGDVAKDLEPELAARGHVVSSNTGANRMHPDVPLLLPEFNADHVCLVETQRRKRGWARGALVCMTNCTIVPVVAALAPLLDFGVEQVHMVSMQAVSGAGYPGVASLDIFDNVVPYINGEEEKCETEPRKILGALHGDSVDWHPMAISAACNRVGVLDGHTVSVSIKFARKPGLEAVRDAWLHYQGHEMVRGLPSAPTPVIAVQDVPDRPQPRLDRDAGLGMTTTIGRLRECPVFDIKFVALSHNTIRGAAGGAIFNAELLVQQGYVS